MLHRGECVARSQLLAEVWQMPPEAVTNVVDVYITYLRRKLEEGPLHKTGSGLIETVRGMGYRLGSQDCEVILRKPVSRELGRLQVVSGATFA